MFYFSCDIPKTDGDVLSCSFHILPPCLFRTKADYTKEELQDILIALATSTTESQMNTPEIQEAITREEISSQATYDLVYEGIYHILYTYVFRTMPTAPLILNAEAIASFREAHWRALGYRETEDHELVPLEVEDEHAETPEEETEATNEAATQPQELTPEQFLLRVGNFLAATIGLFAPPPPAPPLTQADATNTAETRSQSSQGLS